MPLVLDISFGSVPQGATGTLNTNFNNIGFYNQKKGVNFVSVRHKATMGIEDLQLIQKGRPMGPYPGTGQGPTGPRFGGADLSSNIALYVQDTTLVERLRMYEPPTAQSRKLLCLVPGPTGAGNETRYEVRVIDSRTLDVSGATGPVRNQKTTSFGLRYTYDTITTTGQKYKIRFNNDDLTLADSFWIGTLDDDDPHNDVTDFLSTWNNYGIIGNRGLVWIVQEDDYSNGVVFRIQKNLSITPGSLFRFFQFYKG